MEDKTDSTAENPLLVRDGLPRFDQIEPEHIVPAVRQLLADADESLTQLEENLVPHWDSLIEPLERIECPFEYGWKPVAHLFGVKNSPELRTAYETVLGEVVSFSLRMKQSEPIYRAIKAIRDGDDWDQLSEVQHRIIEAALRSAELAGVALEGEQRNRFNDCERELSQLSTKFSNHVLDSVKAFSMVLTSPHEVDGLPESALQLAAQSYNQAKSEDDPEATPESGPWRITLDPPSFQPFMEHARRRDLRETLYREFITKASEGDNDNTPIIQKTLKLRQEKARLLGYANYAEVSLVMKMAPSVEAVEEMSETLRAAAWTPAQTDLDEVRELAAETGQQEPVMNWDVAFWAERLREKRFDFTDEQLRPYFPLERVLDGLFQLVNRLFGITVFPATENVPVWHPDVRFFHVNDEAGQHIASFYLDPYSRPENKRSGAWMDECLIRRRLDGTLQLPVAHLVCNSTPPVGKKPSLMTFRDVETLFHEFGHGLQHMLTKVDYPDASGINGVEWDAVELPSQFMENWCYHKPTLLGLSAHYQTGEPLPEDLFQKISDARTFRVATQTLRQLTFGMVDMELHSRYDPDGPESVFDVQRRISERTSLLPPLPEDRSLCSFQHIFAGGYAAGYYSYKWAEVLSADAFGAFEDAGLDNDVAVAKTGRRFRDTVLAMGGGRHPMDVFKDFRGREPDPKALLRQYGLL